MAETRKLAAILVSDVAGYSRLAGADEDRALARLRALRSDLIDPINAVHHGRVVKRTGDGAIVEFRSVVDAVRCAIEVQHGMVERNAGVPAERRIEFRIGIHLGDVVEESDGDLMGEGVNIAARLQSVAKPGGICLSEDAYRHVKGRLDLKVSDLGPTQLKNIAEPVRIYALDIGKRAEAQSAKPATSALAKKNSLLAPLVVGVVSLCAIAAVSVWLFQNLHQSAPADPGHLSMVVLPFANLSGDPNQDYFADGVTENLTTELSRIRNSFVIARNTAFTFKGKNLDAKEIGKELGVRYVLEGSVQRDQNRVRVNAQLVDAESGAHLWADRFEEDLADLFKLQDQVVARLSNTLGNELLKAEVKKSNRSTNPDSIDLDMRSWALLQVYPPTKESNAVARGLVERALRINPDDADALAGEAFTYFRELYNGWTEHDTDYDAKVLGQVDRAIALAPDNIWGYFVKSIYLGISHRPDEAVEAADTGLATNPNSAVLYGARCTAEIFLGRFEQAKSDARQAMRLSPRDPRKGLWHSYLGLAEFAQGRYDTSIDEYHRALDGGYQSYITYSGLAAALVLGGKVEEAKTTLAEARRLNPKLTVKSLIEHTPNIPTLFESLRKAGLQEE
jgi:adenylate cyclase